MGIANFRTTLDPENESSNDAGGLLGRLLVLQAQQGSYQPISVSNTQAVSPPQDPNFRRLARVYVTNSKHDETDSDQSDSNYPNLGTNDALQPFVSNPGSLAPPIKTAQVVALPGPLPPPPVSMPMPKIPMPATPDWWKAVGPIMRILTFTGPGKYNNYNRCMRAATGDPEEWLQFCGSLNPAENKVLNGQSVKKACESKAYESELAKKNWCANQFGDF